MSGFSVRDIESNFKDLKLGVSAAILCRTEGMTEEETAKAYWKMVEALKKSEPPKPKR